MNTEKSSRNQSLDALRGFAILAMVLSSSIAFGVLPGWMYHAQVPPPGHVFSPGIPGISWVDLVFPFFLFSLGAAIPLSLDKKLKEGGSAGTILYTAGRRWVLLVFFAFFTFYMRAGMFSAHPSTGDYLLSIAAFLLLVFQFYQPTSARYGRLFLVIRILAYGAGLALLFLLPFKDGQGFSTGRIDIIILVLGNMVFFGTIIWWLTRQQPMWRIAVLPFIMAVFLGAGASGGAEGSGLAGWLYNWSPLPWMYKFYYLKYLFIIIPGTLAGDWLLADAAESRLKVVDAGNGGAAGIDGRMRGITILSLALVSSNVVLLYGRHLLLNLILTVLLLLCTGYLVRGREKLLRRFFQAGAYLLLLGLFFEGYEGGIKKDPSTYSYYLVCSGLAFFMLTGFYGLQQTRIGGAIVQYLGQNGRNPMVAYTAGNLLLIPLLQLTGGMALLDKLGGAPWPGFLRGLLFTGVVSLITVFFTRQKWFWKT